MSSFALGLPVTERPNSQNLKTTTSCAHRAFKFGKYASQCLGALPGRLKHRFDPRKAVRTCVADSWPARHEGTTKTMTSAPKEACHDHRTARGGSGVFWACLPFLHRFSLARKLGDSCSRHRQPRLGRRSLLVGKLTPASVEWPQPVMSFGRWLPRAVPATGRIRPQRAKPTFLRSDCADGRQAQQPDACIPSRRGAPMARTPLDKPSEKRMSGIPALRAHHRAKTVAKPGNFRLQPWRPDGLAPAERAH